MQRRLWVMSQGHFTKEQNGNKLYWGLFHHWLFGHKFYLDFYCKCKSVSVISFQSAWCLNISVGPEQPHQSTTEINPLTGLKERGRKVKELLKIVELLRRAGRDKEGVWGSAETIRGSWNRKHCRTDRQHQPAAGYHLQTQNLCSFRLAQICLIKTKINVDFKSIKLISLLKKRPSCHGQHFILTVIDKW